MSTEESAGPGPGPQPRLGRIARRPRPGPDATRRAGAAALGLEPAELTSALFADLAALGPHTDPFAFELTVSSFLGIVEVADTARDAGKLHYLAMPSLLAGVEARADGLALAVLATVTEFGRGVIARLTGHGAALLWADGVLPPDWFDELDRAIVPEAFLSVRTGGGRDRLLLCAFRRGAHRHGFAVSIGRGGSGAVEAILPIPESGLPERLEDLAARLVPAAELESAVIAPLIPVEARMVLAEAISRRAGADRALDLTARFAQWTPDERQRALGAPPVGAMLPVLRHRIVAMTQPAGSYSQIVSDIEYHSLVSVMTRLIFPDDMGGPHSAADPARPGPLIAEQPGPDAARRTRPRRSRFADRWRDAAEAAAAPPPQSPAPEEEEEEQGGVPLDLAQAGRIQDRDQDLDLDLDRDLDQTSRDRHQDHRQAEAFREFPELASFPDVADFPRPPRQRTPAPAAHVYRLRIDLKDAKPPIWRRVEVPGDLTLAALHEVIQALFGWEGYHLHVFQTPRGDYGGWEADLGYDPDSEVTVEQVLRGVGARMLYVYDYGDYWEHAIRVEAVLPADPGADYPRCTGGRRAAPPEDCGGMWAYQESLREQGIAGEDVFDREEVERRLNGEGWQPS